MHDADDEKVLRTSIGEFPLNEYRLKENGREWRILHVGAVISRDEESEYLLNPDESLPYGVTLWASAIALAHELASRDDFHAKSAIELGAGTGLPGIVAATNGAALTQTDSNYVALRLAQRNLALNDLKTVRQRHVDWANWDDVSQYELILGSDILYSEASHPNLRRIFDNNLTPGGRILLSDPFRAMSLRLLESLEKDGWQISMTKYRIGEDASPRPIGIFELTLPTTQPARPNAEARTK